MWMQNRRFHLVAGGFFALLDQLAKYLARTSPTETWYLIKPWLGWEYFANPGIGFSIPFPNVLIIVLTPPILLVLTALAVQKKRAHLSLAFTLLIAGAVSNYIDRVLFEATIDYLRVFTSIINLADLMITAGAALILFQGRWQRERGLKEQPQSKQP